MPRTTGPAPRPRRPRGRPPGPRTATRAKIFEAASSLFAERGFDRTSMRQVARRAGVDPALIYHYFPSKEELFMARFREEFVPLHVPGADEGAGTDQLGERIVRRFLGDREKEGPHGAFLSLLRSSATRPTAAAALRRFIEETVPDSVARYLPGRPRERVGLVSAQLLGLALAREILGVKALRRLTTAELSALLGPRITDTLVGPLPLPVPRRVSARSSPRGRPTLTPRRPRARAARRRDEPRAPRPVRRKERGSGAWI